MEDELIEWVSARQAIFRYDGLAPKEYWERLANAEQALMAVGVKLKETK